MLDKEIKGAFPPPRPHQFATVTAGTRRFLVWSFKVPKGYVFFIDTLASNWFPDTFWNFEIDSADVEGNIERHLGDMETPNIIKPEFIARARVDFYVTNNDTTSHTFEILCSGLVMRDKNRKFY